MFLKRLITLSSIALLTGSSFAVTINDELTNKLDNNKLTTIQQNNEDLRYQTFNSCTDMDTVLNTLVKKYQKQYQGGGYGRGMMEGDIAVDSAVPTSVAEKGTSATIPETAGGLDFSTTNIQVSGVDEPDIMKTDGHTIYYINSEDNMIEVVKSPLSADGKTTDLTQAEHLSEIRLPTTLNGQKQLFLSKGTLILLSQWYDSKAASKMSMPQWVDRTNKLMVITYDVSNPSNPKLSKVITLDGQYTDARLVDGTLRIVANQYFNRWNIVESRKGKIESTSSTISARSLFPKVTQKIGTNKTSKTYTPNCASVQYIVPQGDDNEHFAYPNFTYVYTVPVAGTAKPGINVLLGNSQQIHMSQNNLYLMESYRSSRGYACPFVGRCMSPWSSSIAQTLIHKFALTTSKANYQSSALVPGSPLTQYSMEEDAAGNFRILTSKWTDKVSTDLHILDSKLKVIAGLYDIEPGEQFKSSRYIGDKLYLVTFRQTDPLFVIDLADSLKPKIIGELKIPGYSTYLHPHSLVGNKQYLVGLGYNVGTSSRGGTVNGGIQLALYEVDYNGKETAASRCDSIKALDNEYKKCLTTVDTKRIAVRVVDQETIASTGSQSEALHNPRVFVMDKNHNVILPIVEQIEKKTGETCYDRYTMSGTQEVKAKRCDPQYQYVAGFAGLKKYSLDTANGISLAQSYDYSSLFAKTTPSSDWNGGQINVWDLWNKGMRVGYIGDSLYAITSDFAHFAQPDIAGKPSVAGSGSFVMFDSMLK